MITILKGNLFNHLKQKLDSSLLDSNQYDLKLVVDEIPTFYRVRFNGEFFSASQIVEPPHFQLPKYSKQADIDELSTFYKSLYYEQAFPYKEIFDSIRRKCGNGIEDYYAYLKKVTDKNSISSEKVYDFMLPSSKQGVIAFEISIELVKKRYYVVFIKEHAEKGYFQSSCTLYSIFDSKNFTRQKNRLEEIVLELCIEYDYPIGLATFLLIMCNQDLDLLKRLMDLFLLARSKQELNILISNEIFSILLPTLRYDEDLDTELKSFILEQKDDISYQFQKKKRD